MRYIKRDVFAAVLNNLLNIFKVYGDASLS